MSICPSGLATLEAASKALKELKDRPELMEWMEQRQAGASQPDHVDDDSGKDALLPEQDDMGARGPQQDRPSSGSQEAPSGSPPARAMRRLVRKAVCAGQEEAEDVRAALLGWGLEPGDLKVVPLAGRLELARALRTPKMRRLADLVGRMKRLSGAAERQKVEERHDEVHSVALGGDLERVLPSELALGLASHHPLRRLDFMRRLLEGTLLSYELEGTDKLKRGLVIAAIDCSSSMRGDPLEWATAVALTLASVAATEGRFAHLIFFNTRIVRQVRLDAAPPPGGSTKTDPRKILAAATVGASGGTAYEPPVRRAIEVMGEGAAKEADVLLVTDGMCQLSGEVAGELDAARKRGDFELLAVLIGERAISKGAGNLASFSNAVIPLERIAMDPGDAARQAGPLFESF